MMDNRLGMASRGKSLWRRGRRPASKQLQATPSACLGMDDAPAVTPQERARGLVEGVPRRAAGQPGREVALLGGGCFWCVEAAFTQLQGVHSAVSGYAGGPLPAPSYEEVCSGETGHAEVVEVTFDPSLLTYRQVLELFFSVHDPTTQDRQGADVGTQYRSVIFTTSAQQERVARQVIVQLEREKVWDDPIVTQVAPAPAFYPAEEYHQRYYERNPNAGYCQAVIRPKLAKFRKAWASKITH